MNTHEAASSVDLFEKLSSEQLLHLLPEKYRRSEMAYLMFVHERLSTLNAWCSPVDILFDQALALPILPPDTCAATLELVRTDTSGMGHDDLLRKLMSMLRLRTARAAATVLKASVACLRSQDRTTELNEALWNLIDSSSRSTRAHEAEEATTQATRNGKRPPRLFPSRSFFDPSIATHFDVLARHGHGATEGSNKKQEENVDEKVASQEDHRVHTKRGASLWRIARTKIDHRPGSAGECGGAYLACLKKLDGSNLLGCEVSAPPSPAPATTLRF